MTREKHMENYLEANDWRDTPLGWMHADLDGEFYSTKDAYEYQLELEKA